MPDAHSYQEFAYIDIYISAIYIYRRKQIRLVFFLLFYIGKRMRNR